MGKNEEEHRNRPAPGVDVRRRALAALATLESEHVGSQQAVREALDRAPRLEGPDRALLTELVYTTLRKERVVDRWLARASARGLVDLDPAVLAALRLGACQLAWLDKVPAYAAIHATVEAAKATVPARAVGFVNGVLQGLLRSQAAGGTHNANPGDHLPDWLAERVRGLAAACNVDEQALLMAFGEPAPLHLHAIRGKDPTTAEALRSAGVTLTELNGVAVPGVWSTVGGAVFASEPFRTRQVLAQDAASAAVVEWLEVRAGARVLDVAAGLGVKSLCLAARGSAVTALDRSAKKLAQAADLAKTAGFPLVGTIVADACAPLPLAAADFDAVLVDAPCTGLGTLRRRPEIRRRRRAADLLRAAETQRQVLAQAAGCVRKGGVLVYAVCSFADEEGALIVDEFLRDHPEFARDRGPAPWVAPLLDARGDMRSHPLMAGMDAFYAARLVRVG
jgi:16S rRNA (cytosine967-C5)-methyltransferase